MFGFALTSQLIQGSAERTWNCVSQFANLLWFKFNHLRAPIMPRSRRRHHSRSRSRSRSHSYDKDRDVKRRKLEAYDSPHKSSVSSEQENIHTVDHENIEVAAATPSTSEQVSDTVQGSPKSNADPEETVNCVKAFSSSEHLETSTKSTDNEQHVDNTASIELSDVPADQRTQKRLDKDSCEVDQESNSMEPSEASVSERANDNVLRDQEVDFDNTEPTEDTENGMFMDIVDEKQKSDLDSTVDLVVTDSEDSKSDSAVKDKSKNSAQAVLTPKQLQKKKEAQRRLSEKMKERENREKLKLEEKERLRQDKLKQKQEREERKNKEKQEKMEQKQRELEQKQKEKELKEEQKRKEREEKESKRKEKEEKEEQKKKEKEQERLKKQQEIEEKRKEKQRIEEQKQKAAAAFVNFFVAKKSGNESKDKESEDNQNALFKNFEVKSDMRLPPERRNPLTNEEKDALTDCVRNPNENCSYLNDLKDKKPTGRCGKTWPYEDPLDEVIIIEDETDLGETICEEKEKMSKLRAKFLKFHENRRPAYFGTWRKQSLRIKPRKPLEQDTNILNYEEDSDDDWEEEEQGESLDDSDGEEKDTEAANDDYEVDNEFFVPHGHLSDDEVDDEATAKLSPESHKQKLKLLKEEFDEDIKSKTNKIKPRFIGCIWYDKESKHIDAPIDKHLKPLSIITNTIIILKKRSENALNGAQNKKSASKLTQLDPALIPDFIRLVHGSVNKRTALAMEFLTYITQSGKEVTVSKASLGRKIKQIADWIKCPEDGPMFNKLCWYVSEDIRKKYNTNVGLPNEWEMTKN